jgi:hypothetical protein
MHYATRRNAHHLRELQALVEIEKEDWARKMQRLLHRLCHVANLTREQGAKLPPGFIALIPNPCVIPAKAGTQRWVPAFAVMTALPRHP